MTRMLRKSYQVKVTAEPGDKGIVDMYASVFGNVDHVKDRVIKGAFTKSLEAFAASGDPIPVIWSHTWDNPYAHVGKVLDYEQDDIGLKTHQQYDMDREYAAQVFHLIKERRVREASFAYDVLNEETDKAGVNNLIELDLIEVGPTLKGANSETRVLVAKSLDPEVMDSVFSEIKTLMLAELKAGRVLSAKNEGTLKQARDMLDQVLSQIASGEDPVKSAAKSVATDDEPQMTNLVDNRMAIANMAMDLMASDLQARSTH